MSYMEKLYDVLNKQVANFSVLFTKLHHFHWYVTGPQFYQLHAKFEEFYDEVNELYDAFAERLLMIGGYPVSNLKGYLAITSLKEASGTEKPEEMVKHILDDFKLIAIELKEALKISQNLGDEVTADLLISTLSSFEKHIWMLSFTLK
ncbi:MAG: DNA starvation/stationary phase protection protein [Tenericutes bacterium GWC2_34_14]|nr:MAG: DNA starvation/stationary phase protection protein [Tenericutes bacterium GWC2_34_14]OHE34101.1 MAG: DNA starvation/stationary phase protection protein [Tenericutes bacterium GWE2_34_108]OHE35431.1 MAG: DNA starvation/stationary phase protection protein [Tenericutes bacterium GWF1_35_14]OHE38423.1 MAG: DNA starvation/stationary phase protection protein [Tenericutes bacterium GWF2_35_184]OHE43063.1 MAG: DNA starvation/stationary phase protection protein [Tenericutes bacterium RIFOXYA2_FU